MNSEDRVSISSVSSSEIKEDTSRARSFPTSTIARLHRKLSTRKPTPVSPDHANAAKSQGCKWVFRYFDENGDGKISAAELQRCVKAVGGHMSPEEAETAVRSSDSDGDGELGFEDFAKLMETGDEEEKKEELRKAFEMYVAKGSGCITPKSLKRMMSRLGESTTVTNCKAMISKFDLNGDGVLNFDEFRLMMG